MSAVRAFQQDLDEIAQLWDEEDYDAALDRVEEARKAWPGNSHLHILWASLVQLQDNPKHSLDEAEQALRQAVELNQSSPAAVIDLGYFLDRVKDDPRAAAETFAQGVDQARQLLIDGLIGRAKALLQVDQVEEAFQHALEVLNLLSCESRTPDHSQNHDLDALLRTGENIRNGSRPPTAEQIEGFLDAVIVHQSA